MIDNIILSLSNETPALFLTPIGSLCIGLLATLGLTFGITHSKLLNWPRRYIPIMSCPQCVGLWSGLFVYFLDNFIFNLAFSSSFICFVVYLVIAKRIKDHA